METLFYISAAVAIIATLLTITRTNAVHAMLNLIVSLLAVGLVFYAFGAPFAAALEVIVYAGAIMVLFIFAVILLNPCAEPAPMRISDLATPGILALVLMAELIGAVTHGLGSPLAGSTIDPKEVGIALFGKYLIGVELASVLLLSGLVDAFHLGERETQPNQSKEHPHVTDTDERRADSRGDLVLAGTDRSSRST